MERNSPSKKAVLNFERGKRRRVINIFEVIFKAIVEVCTIYVLIVLWYRSYLCLYYLFIVVYLMYLFLAKLLFGGSLYDSKRLCLLCCPLFSLSFYTFVTLFQFSFGVGTSTCEKMAHTPPDALSLAEVPASNPSEAITKKKREKGKDRSTDSKKG